MRTPAPKTLICAAALLALLVAGGATAQQDMGNTAATGATFTTGVLKARTADSLTLAKDDGETVTLLVDVATVGLAGLENEQRVRVDYHVNEYGQAVADVVQAGAPAPTTIAASAPAEPAVAAPTPLPSETATVELEPTPAIEREVEARAEIEPAPAEVAVAEPESLPATASRLPLLVLLGAATLGAALVLRLAR
jgi:hypothetical protein